MPVLFARTTRDTMRTTKRNKKFRCRSTPISKMTADTDPSEPTPPAYSDDALALAFAARHADQVRFVIGSGWNSWLIRNAEGWCRDESLETLNLARVFCREVAAACDDEATKLSICSSQRISAVERLARCDRRLA